MAEKNTPHCNALWKVDLGRMSPSEMIDRLEGVRSCTRDIGLWVKMRKEAPSLDGAERSRL